MGTEDDRSQGRFEESRLLRLLGARGQVRELRPREVLCLQYEDGDDVFVVVSGELVSSVSLIAGGVMSRETSRVAETGYQSAKPRIEAWLRRSPPTVLPA